MLLCFIFQLILYVKVKLQYDLKKASMSNSVITIFLSDKDMFVYRSNLYLF